jgi:hypothetical protein
VTENSSIYWAKLSRFHLKTKAEPSLWWITCRMFIARLYVRPPLWSSGRTVRIPRFVDNRLTDGGEVASLTRRTLFTPRKIPGTHLCLRLSRSHGRYAPNEKVDVQCCFAERQNIVLHLSRVSVCMLFLSLCYFCGSCN